MHLCVVRVDVEQGWQKLLMHMTFQLGMHAGMFYLIRSINLFLHYITKIYYPVFLFSNLPLIQELTMEKFGISLVCFSVLFSCWLLFYSDGLHLCHFISVCFLFTERVKINERCVIVGNPVILEN